MRIAGNCLHTEFSYVCESDVSHIFCSSVPRLMLIRAQYYNVQATLNGITTTTTNTMTIVQSIHSSSTNIDKFNLSSNELSEQSATITTSSYNNNKTQISRDRKAIMWRYWTPFGTIAWRSARSSITFGRKGVKMNPLSKTEDIVTFIPSFFSRCVELQFATGCGVVSRQLRTYSVVPRDHQIFIMCQEGNLKGMQDCLSEGKVSPFCVDGYGNSLLHVSMLLSVLLLSEILISP